MDVRVYVASVTDTTNVCRSASATTDPLYDRILRHLDVIDRLPLPVARVSGALLSLIMLKDYRVRLKK